MLIETPSEEREALSVEVGTNFQRENALVTTERTVYVQRIGRILICQWNQYAPPSTLNLYSVKRTGPGKRITEIVRSQTNVQSTYFTPKYLMASR